MKPTLFIAFLIAAALAYNHAIAPESPLGITAATTTPAIADNIEVHYYRIHGVSAEALRDEMNRKGPLFNGKRFDAVTRWHVYWQFQYDMHGSRCVMRDVQTRTETNMTLPRWETRSTARQPLQQQLATAAAILQY